VLGSPYQSEIIDENGEFTLDFLVAAQPLLKRRVGIWANSELSWWDPGHTICVLVHKLRRPCRLLRRDRGASPRRAGGSTVFGRVQSRTDGSVWWNPAPARQRFRPKMRDLNKSIAHVDLAGGRP
jgi:hypothetical protein